MADQNPSKKNVIDLRQLTAQTQQPTVPTPLPNGAAGNTTGAAIANDPYNIPAVVREKYPEMVTLITQTKSMSDDERKYWFQVLPIMTAEQITKLKDILVTEKTQLTQLDKQYEQEINKLNEKHLMEWKEFEAREKRRKIQTREKEQQAESQKVEEELMQKLANI